VRIVEIALFTAALLVVGLVVLALLWSGTAPYADLARANRVDHETFIVHGEFGTAEAEMDLPQLVEWHRLWSTYVTGGSDTPPIQWGGRVFSDDEYAHMADVRRVFDGAKFLVPLALFVMVVRLQRARARGPSDMWRLVRTGSLAAATLVAAIGVVAALAFEPLFLLFHYVFFPQGNFLFDPATSNLVRLYPDWYWQGVTLRVGASFAAVTLGLAAIAHLRLTGRLA